MADVLIRDTALPVVVALAQNLRDADKAEMALMKRAHRRHDANRLPPTFPAGDHGAKLSEAADDRRAHAGAPSPKLCSGAGKVRVRTLSA